MNNTLTLAANAAVTMSSREIAELTGKRHDNVMTLCRSIRDMGVCPEIQETPYINEQNGQTYFECRLSKRDSLVLIARISPEFTAAVVDRWQELEAKQARPAELSRMDILKIAMEAEQARLEAEAKLSIAAPKIQFFDKVVERKTLMTATQVGQKLGMSAVALNKHLDDLDVYSKNIKRARVFKQWFVDKGYGELKQTELGHSQPLFTTSGEAWIIERMVSEGYSVSLQNV